MIRTREGAIFDNNKLFMTSWLIKMGMYNKTEYANLLIGVENPS